MYVIIFIIFEILKPQTAYIRVVLFKNGRKVNLKMRQICNNCCKLHRQITEHFLYFPKHSHHPRRPQRHMRILVFFIPCTFLLRCTDTAGLAKVRRPMYKVL